MREIKFRVWDKSLNKMQYKAGLAIRGNEIMGDSLNIPMQFTGLKDKNGKEIYEGDIVLTEWLPSDPNPKLEVVEYEDCEFFPMVDVGRNKDWGVFGNDFEVMGNIYENEDLLKDK